MTTEEFIQRLAELEGDVRYQEPPSDTEAEFRHTPGRIPVLVSAPHGAVHTRGGAPKEEDEFTAGLARLLAEETGAHVLYARRRSAGDPNADPVSPYKDLLYALHLKHGLRFVLDLHGASRDHPFGMALGTMKGRSCPPPVRRLLLDTLDRHGFSDQGDGLQRLDVDQKMSASGKDGRVPVTKFCHQKGLPAAQIELNARLRIPIRPAPFPGSHERIHQAFDTLAALLRNVADYYEAEGRGIR